MARKAAAPKVEDTVVEDGKRLFVTAKVDIRSGSGITMVKKDQRVAVTRDYGRFGVEIENPLYPHYSLARTWRLYNHELKGTA